MQTTETESPVTAPSGDAAPTRLPPLSEEDRYLLHNYIALEQNPVKLADQTGREYLDIIDFTSRPDIAAWISHIDTLHVRNLRDSALAELETCLRSSRDPVERRRAATTILRATDPRPIRSRKPARTHEPAAPAKTITNHTSDTHEPAASFEPPAPAEEVTNLASTTGQDAAPAMNASSPTSTSNELASPAEAVTDPAATNIEPAPPQHPCDLARNAPTKPLNGLARPPSFPP